MADLTIGGQFDVDPEDITTLAFSWEGHFDEGILLDGAGTMTVENYSDPSEAPAAMTIPFGPELNDDNISVTFQVAGGTRGNIYRVSHEILTAEAHAQERKRSFYVQVRAL